MASVAHKPMWQVRLKLLQRGAASTWTIFRESKVGLVGVGIILLYALLMVAHPILMDHVWERSVYDPVIGYDRFLDWMTKYQIYDVAHPSPPSFKYLPVFWELYRAGEIGFGELLAQTLRHPLGTDPLGRDILSQLMYSTREEFILGVVSAVITVLIGTLVGTTAAYFGGWVDTLFMRLADIILLFPTIPLLIVVSSMTELSLFGLALTLGIAGGLGGITIVLKSQALSIKVRPYIEAARVAGGGHWWVIRRHIIPNVMPLSFLYMMFSVTSAILSEATLSFFGLLNIRISWGLMIHTAQSAGYLLSFDEYWWLWLPAGLSITLLCAAFYLVGRGLDQAVNPRLRNR